MGVPSCAAISVPSTPLPAVTKEPARPSDPLLRFHAEHPSLAEDLPHHNDRNGSTLHHVEVTCDKCDTLLPPSLLQGVINDYAYCTEVRYVGLCPQCQETIHNVLRLAGREMRFVKDGKWHVTTLRPWWQRFWPWPLDRES